MAFNGAGTYSLPANTWNPAVTNTAINSTDWNAIAADLATALSTCMLKDGQQTPTANIPMGGFKFTGLAAGSATGNSLRYEQLFTTGAVNLLGPINEVKTTVASAATPDIWTSIGNVVDYTGTVTATGFAAAPQAGARRVLICAAAAPFTAGANMLIDGVASGSTYTAIAGDRINVVAVTTTQFRLTTPHTPFVDSYPVVQGSADATKQVRFEVDGLTTGTTRVLTVQDSDDTLVGRATTDTLTNKTLTNPTIVGFTLSGTLSGTGIASQANQEAGSTTTLVTSAFQQFHPSAAKGWVKATVTGSSTASYNVTSVTDDGTGVATIVWNVDFSSTEYCAVATPLTTLGLSTRLGNNSAGQIQVVTYDTVTQGNTDPSAFMVLGFGDQ